MRRPLAALSASTVALFASLAFAHAQPGLRPPSPTTPQTTPGGGLTDDGSTVVEALEITARPLGPAMWRVKRGDSEVVIVGGYSPLPHSLEWNKVRLNKALDGAQAFYEPKASINPFEIAGYFFRQGQFKLDRGQTLDGVIGPARAARLRRVVAIAHSDPERMQPFKPSVAGVFSYQTFVRTVGWSAEKPGTTIRRMASAYGLGSRALAKLSAPSVINALTRSDMAAQLACFDATLDQTEWESAHGVDAARAWAEGRVSDLRRLRSTAILDRCLIDNGGARATVDKGIADSTASIEEILSKPGKSVALIDMTFLLPKNGVLDRLKARGADIAVPPG